MSFELPSMFPRESGKFIAEHSKHVTIIDEGVATAAKTIAQAVVDDQLKHVLWDGQPAHEISGPKDAAAHVEWCFVVDTLNFSFWPASSKKWKVTYGGETWTGYYALCACINRAIDQGIEITNAEFYADVSEECLAKILMGDDNQQIPLFPQRLDVIHEAGSVLCQKFDGRANNFVKSANFDAQTILKDLITNFSSYRDIGEYNGKRVSLLKRAQIFIADVNGTSAENKISNMDTLTMFADYRVPQALVHLGVIGYSEEMIEALNNQPGEFENLEDRGISEQFEHEIRGCSIHACDKIVTSANALLTSLNRTDAVTAADVDYFLWCHRRKYADEIQRDVPPMHKVRTIYY